MDFIQAARDFKRLKSNLSVKYENIELLPEPIRGKDAIRRHLTDFLTGNTKTDNLVIGGSLELKYFSSRLMLKSDIHDLLLQRTALESQDSRAANNNVEYRVNIISLTHMSEDPIDIAPYLELSLSQLRTVSTLNYGATIKFLDGAKLLLRRAFAYPDPEDELTTKIPKPEPLILYQAK